MKLRLAFGILAGLLLLSCEKKVVEEGEIIVDRNVSVFWTYKNSTDKEITVTSYYNKNEYKKEYKTDLSFLIPVDGEYVITDGGIGYNYPFQWKTHAKDRYLVISNGEKQFTQLYSHRAYVKTLYSEDTYVYTTNPENDYILYFTYTFTDEDFKNAKPIE